MGQDLCGTNNTGHTVVLSFGP